jgi:phytoene dehydrogenase-like protein
VRIDGTTLTLASGERLQARAIVVATEGPAAARLVEGLPPPGSREVTCLYFAAEQPPIDEPLLLLDADRRGPVNNMCVPSVVADSYAPAGANLISVTVLGSGGESDSDLEEDVRRQLAEWFGAAVRRWECLRMYRIAHALPEIVPRSSPASGPPVKDRPGLSICGDHTANPSIQGAMVSGRRAAEAILRQI